MKVKLRCFPILLIFLIGYLLYYNENETSMEYTSDYNYNEENDRDRNDNSNKNSDKYFNWDDIFDNHNDDETPGVFNKNSKITDIKKSSDKVNIYMFWGDGCPHCEEQFEFLESIQDEYGTYFNLYAFEVWYNEDNKELMNEFATAMNETIRGVPYTIIGDESFSGFSKSSEDDLLDAIKEERLSNDDIYFDKIK